MSRRSSLALSAQAAGAEDPHQRKFKRLLAQIDKARQELADWDAASPQFVQAHAELIQPRLREFSRLRWDLVQRFDTLLAETKGWARADAELIAELLCGNAADLCDDEALSAADRERCRLLHDAYSPQSLDELEKEAVDEMKAFAQTMTGVELGDEVSTPEEVLQRLHQHFSDARPEPEPAAMPRRRKPGKAAAARAQREQAEAQAAQQSVREVYRKLAAALHPDRAADDADRALRTERMQRVNQAYARDDLLALLSLQLEIEQIDPEHATRVTSQRASQFNVVLAEQLQELKQTLTQRHAAFAEGFGLHPRERFSAKTLGALLHRLKLDAELDVEELRRDLRQLGAGKPAVRTWLKQARRDVEAADSPLAWFGTSI